MLAAAFSDLPSVDSPGTFMSVINTSAACRLHHATASSPVLAWITS